MTDTINTLADPGSDPAHEWLLPELPEFTPDEYRTAAKVLRARWNQRGFPYSARFAAAHCAAEADRLEAESARDEEAEKLACARRGYMADQYDWMEWPHLSDVVRAAEIDGMRFILDQIAADGRLLPEGGAAPKREYCSRGRCAALEGHEGTCEEASGFGPVSGGFDLPAAPAPEGGTDWQKRFEKAEAEVEAEIAQRDAWEERLTSLIYTFATVEEVGEWSNTNELDETFIEFMQGKIADLERRALPEGGTVLTAEQERLRRNPDTIARVQKAQAERDQAVRVEVTPPAVSVPDSTHPYFVWEQGYMASLEDAQGGADGSPDHPFTSNPYSLGEPVPAVSFSAGLVAAGKRAADTPDGTTEKPWPTWQDVPEGVRYQGSTRYGDRSPVFVNREGQRITEWHPGVEFANTHPDWVVDRWAPFVRVDGDKKEDKS